MSRNFVMSYSPNSSSAGAVNNHQPKGAVNNHPKRFSNKGNRSNKFADYSPSDSDSDNQAPPPRRNNNGNNRKPYNGDNRGNNYKGNNQGNNGKRHLKPRERDNREYIPPPEPRPVNYIELIPTHFNSSQVRILCDQFWAAGDLDNIEGLLHFFYALRKAIIHVNVKDKIEVLDPKYPNMLQAIQVPDLDPLHSFFSEEITPRVDGSTNYDEEVWFKMFIQMLPRPSQPIPITIRCFKLICEISQQITQTEVAVIRFKLLRDAKGPMQSELNALGDRQDREGWSDEKYAAEEEKVIKKWNAKMYKDKDARLKEVWAMYDKMLALITEANVGDFNNRYVLGTWRFLTRNPCFPEPSITIGSQTFPAAQFSLVEVFNNPSISYAHAFAHIRKWFYGKHPTIDAVNPSQIQFQDWMNVCLFYQFADDLATFSSKDCNIESIALFDNRIFQFISSWIETQYGQKPRKIETNTYTTIVNGVEETFTTNAAGAWVKSYNIYPYYSLRLFEESYESEVIQSLNAINECNFSWLSVIIGSFNHQVIRDNIVNRLLKGHASAGSLVKLAGLMEMNMLDLAKHFESEFIKLARPSVDVLHTVAHVILSEAFNEPLVETFNRFVSIVAPVSENPLADKNKYDTALSELLNGFALAIPVLGLKCLALKPNIVEIATRISTTAKFGAAKYVSIDVLEAFEKLQ